MAPDLPLDVWKIILQFQSLVCVAAVGLSSKYLYSIVFGTSFKSGYDGGISEIVLLFKKLVKPKCPFCNRTSVLPIWDQHVINCTGTPSPSHYKSISDDVNNLKNGYLVQCYSCKASVLRGKSETQIPTLENQQHLHQHQELSVLKLMDVSPVWNTIRKTMEEEWD